MIARNAALQSDGLMLSGRLYLPDDGKGKTWPVVCLCHGIPSGLPRDPAEGGYPELAETICGWGFAVFIFNFRGAGTSEGNLDIGGWASDLATVMDHLDHCPELDVNKIILIGFSAGAMVSLYTAAHDKRVDSVISCSCPAEFGFSNPEKAIERFKEIGVIRNPDFPRSVENWAKAAHMVSPVFSVAEISPRPVMFIHGEEDEVVDVSEARRLHLAAREPKSLHILPGVGHRVRNTPEARELIKNFLISRLDEEK